MRNFEANFLEISEPWNQTHLKNFLIVDRVNCRVRSIIVYHKPSTFKYSDKYSDLKVSLESAY